jgi:hypothetical protein
MTEPITIKIGEPEDAAAVLRLWVDAEAAESTTDDEAAIRGSLARDRDAAVAFWTSAGSRPIRASAGSSGCCDRALQVAPGPSVY